METLKELNGIWMNVFFKNGESQSTIIFTDTIENAKKQVLSLYGNVDEIVFVEMMKWADFKKLFDTSNWIDPLKYNEDGFFPEEVFEQVCEFCFNGFIKVLESRNFKGSMIEISNN